MKMRNFRVISFQMERIGAKKENLVAIENVLELRLPETPVVDLGRS